MNKEDFLLLLNHSQTGLSLQNKLDILSDKDKYPYCSLLQFVNLLNNKTLDLSGWQQMIPQVSIYMVERNYFKSRLNAINIQLLDENKQDAINKINKTNLEEDDSKEKIGIIPIETKNENIIPENTKQLEKEENTIDVLLEINAYEEITFKTASKKELIEKFLEIQSPKIQKPTLYKEITTPETAKEENTIENLNFVSETLAILYEKQRNLPQAIKIYEQLSLKYPEKSTTFASQIERLKNLINKQTQ